MRLSEAQYRLKPGVTVVCPPDRGDKGYRGVVTHVGLNLCTHSLLHEPYLWVEVQHPSGSKHIWPSNRLG